MPNTIFIDTNTLPRVPSPQGEFTEILNGALVGAKNVLGVLRWIRPGEEFKANAGNKHQLLYLMEGSGNITLESKNHEVTKGMGIYLGPSETATISATGSTVKVFHLTVQFDIVLVWLWSKYSTTTFVQRVTQVTFTGSTGSFLFV